jgi:hypothetical protein
MEGKPGRAGHRLLIGGSLQGLSFEYSALRQFYNFFRESFGGLVANGIPIGCQ